MQVDLRQLQGRLRVFDVSLQRGAVNDGGLQILARHLQRGLRLVDIGAALGGTRQSSIPLTDRQRAIGGKIFYALEVSLGFLALRAGVFQCRLVTLDHRFGAFTLLQVVVQGGDFHRQLGFSLVYPLAVDTIVNLQQQVALPDALKILHFDLGDIAVHLRADKGGLAAHVSVIGKLGMAGKRR